MGPCVASCLCSRVGSVAVAVPAPTILCFAPLSIVMAPNGGKKSYKAGELPEPATEAQAPLVLFANLSSVPFHNNLLYADMTPPEHLNVSRSST